LLNFQDTDLVATAVRGHALSETLSGREEWHGNALTLGTLCVEVKTNAAEYESNYAILAAFVLGVFYTTLFLLHLSDHAQRDWKRVIFQIAIAQIVG
jgi:hypothetical protein